MSAHAGIAAAYLESCAEELAALKPGNVHVHAEGHRMTVADFTRSAAVSAPKLCVRGARLGERIRGGVAATRQAVGQNTNLGILLLCAPLAMAAEQVSEPGRLADGVNRVIRQSDLADAEAVFAAIRMASPGGLGAAPRHDVHATALVTLPRAMAEAAGRDSIARQWCCGFADIFGDALALYEAARARWPEPEWAALAAYLHFLATWPDSHVARRHGAASAARLQCSAAHMRTALRTSDDPRRLLPRLAAWDAALKSAAINPGTSADLTVATAFAFRLRNGLPFRGVDG
jgi:triphosphoribosyl-dephospho-CoA synthase